MDFTKRRELSDSRLLSWLVVIISLTATTSASAATNLTDVPPTDVSFSYMRFLFGSIVDVIQGGTGPSSPDHVIGAMSQVLNSGMLIFTGIIAGYVFLTGVLNSANEGTALGKAYNTMWIPMRMVLALSLILPFSGGYSAMQVGVIWMGGQGIGLADSVWTGALDFLSSSGGLYPPDLNINEERMGKAYLESRVCMHGLNVKDRYVNLVDTPVTKIIAGPAFTARTAGTVQEANKRGSSYIAMIYGNDLPPAAVTASYIANAFTGFSNGTPRYYGKDYCGRISLDFETIMADVPTTAIINEYRVSINTIHSTLDNKMDELAKKIVAHAEKPATNPAPNPNLFKQYTDIYKAQYKAAVQTTMSKLAQEKLNRFAGESVAGSSLSARDAGWLSAGAYYWDIQKINAETQSLIKIDPSVKEPNRGIASFQDYKKFQKGLDDYLKGKTFVNRFGETTTQLADSAYSNEGLMNVDNELVLGTIKGLISATLTSPDPITGLQSAGHNIITFLELNYLATVIPRRTFQAADAAAQNAGVWGMPARVLTWIAKSISEEVYSGMLVMMFLIIPLALMLAFYLPATPLILWILGVAGWFILLIEAVIAAPIWAASHAMPEGEGFVGQRAMAGYMVILSLFLRPTLMLFGFFSSMVLMIVMTKVTLLLFIPFIAGMNGSFLTGLVTLFASLGILVNLLIQLSHRCFGLIHEIPDKVLRYIGGGGENLGESSGESSNKQGFSAGAAAAMGAGKESLKSSAKKKSDIKAKAQEASAADKAAADKATADKLKAQE